MYQTKTISIRNMPLILWHQVKVLAAKRGISIKQLIISLLEAEIAKDK
jgi:hypothetical protein